MSKLQELKKALSNPPPKRLAEIEYKSHFYNILGNLIVSIILIVKGHWYIIFAFIFMVGVSYSQGMSAYQKYLMIKKIMGETSIEDDKSPTRRRRRIIEQNLGKGISYFTILIGILISYLLYNPFYSSWYGKIAFVLLIFSSYIVIYYFPIYWLARMKGGLNGK